MNTQPTPPPEILTYPPEVQRHWFAKYDEAYDAYDAGEFAEAIKMLKNFLEDPECPEFCHIRFMLLLASCYAEYDDVDLWVRCLSWLKSKS